VQESKGRTGAPPASAARCRRYANISRAFHTNGLGTCSSTAGGRETTKRAADFHCLEQRIQVSRIQQSFQQQQSIQGWLRSLSRYGGSGQGANQHKAKLKLSICYARVESSHPYATPTPGRFSTNGVVWRFARASQKPTSTSDRGSSHSRRRRSGPCVTSRVENDNWWS